MSNSSKSNRIESFTFNVCDNNVWQFMTFCDYLTTNLAPDEMFQINIINITFFKIFFDIPSIRKLRLRFIYIYATLQLS